MVFSRDYFLGQWSFRRHIQDRRHVKEWAAQGNCTFTPEGENLVYVERGVILNGEYQSDFFQKYLFRFPQPGVLQVYFPDGRLFYEISGSNASISHQCNQDHYAGLLIYLDSHSWRQSWDVRGPKKSYQMNTIYQINAS